MDPTYSFMIMNDVCFYLGIFLTWGRTLVNPCLRKNVQSKVSMYYSEDI